MIKEYQLRKRQNSFEVVLNYKGVKVKVAFTGGNTYKGVYPKLRTDNAFKMKAIEASQLFKDKEVVLVRTIDRESDVKPVVQQRARRATVAPQPAKPAAKKVEPAPAKAEDDTTSMSFDNLGEAIQYIAQQWQIGVQTEAEARKVLKEHGITPRIKKG